MHHKEELAFHSALCHYFLWKSAQEAAREETEVAEVIATIKASTAAASDANNASKKPPAREKAPTKSQKAATSKEDNASGPHAPTASTDGEKMLSSHGEAKTRSSKCNDDTKNSASATAPANADGDFSVKHQNSRSSKFKRLHDAMRKEFPEIPELPADANVVYPIIAARYSIFPQLHQEVVQLRNRNRELSSHQPPSVRMNTAKRKNPPSAAAATIRTTKKATPATKTTGMFATKQVTTVVGASKEEALATIDKETAQSPIKKRRIHDDLPVNMSMQIGQRPDVPEDVKKLVSLVRDSARQEKYSAKRKIARLKAKVVSVQEKAKQAPPPQPPPVAPTPAPAPRVTAPLKEPPPSKPPKTFEDRFAELEYFKKGNGHCRVPTRWPGLGRWVADIRILYRSLQTVSEEERYRVLDLPGGAVNTLTHERIARLNELGFEWNPAPPMVPWETRYGELVEYKEKHGHTRVPRNWKENPSLGEWVHIQRRQNKLKAEILSEERKEKLNALGFVWKAGADKPTFEGRLEECRNFRRTHGHLNVPRSLDIKKNEGPQISNEEKSFYDWAHRQREEYRRFNSGQKCRIDRGRIKKLTELGFEWSSEKRIFQGIRRKAWNEQYAKLKHCYELLGNINDINNLKATYPGDDSILEWVKTQRKMWKNQQLGSHSTMTTARREQLEALEFDFAPRRNFAPRGSKKAGNLEVESVSTEQSDE